MYMYYLNIIEYHRCLHWYPSPACACKLFLYKMIYNTINGKSVQNENLSFQYHHSTHNNKNNLIFIF